MEPDRPIPPGTRTGNRKRTGMRYNRYGYDFLIDKIQPDKLGEELLSGGELEAEEEWQVIDDGGHYPQEDYSTPELETDLEQSEIERRENTNLRILEWMRDVKEENYEGQSIQQVDVSSERHKKTEDPLFGWTSAISITADMSFKSRLETDFKREYQNVEFLFRQRPGLGGMAALPPSVAQVPGKYLCFLVTRVNERNTIDPEHVMLALTRLRDFIIERRITEVSMPVYDPNRGKLSPRELYAILHVVFAETEIIVHLHKKCYLSIA